MEKLGENVKKLLLAGIGAAAVTAEKSKELLDEMVKKGELTVEQGKVLNEELKHNLKKTVQENVHKAEKQTSTEEADEAAEENYGGIVLIGSHVKKTTLQLEELKKKLYVTEGDGEKDDCDGRAE